MLCWLFRLMISHAVDGNNRLAGKTQKHIGRCASCRDFYHSCLSLAQDLTRQAAIPKRDVSERLSGRILSVVSGQETKEYKVTVKLWPIVTAACLALAILIGAYFLIPEDGDKNITESDPVAALRQLAQEEFAPSLSGFNKRPLEGELDNIAKETASAVRFLVACVDVDIAGFDPISPE